MGFWSQAATLEIVTILRVIIIPGAGSHCFVSSEWVSASEGQKFAELLSDFTTELAKLGPRSRV